MVVRPINSSIDARVQDAVSARSAIRPPQVTSLTQYLLEFPISDKRLPERVGQWDV